MSAVSSCVGFRLANITCQCASIRPGISTRPPQSISRAPSGAPWPAHATCLIRPSSIRKLWPPRKPRDLPSNSWKLVMTVGGAARAACALALGAKPRPASAPAAPASIPRRESSRVIRRSADRTVGWQQRQAAAPASASPSATQVNNCDLTARERRLPTSGYHWLNAWLGKRRLACRNLYQGGGLSQLGETPRRPGGQGPRGDWRALETRRRGKGAPQPRPQPRSPQNKLSEGRLWVEPPRSRVRAGGSGVGARASLLPLWSPVSHISAGGALFLFGVRVNPAPLPLGESGASSVKGGSERRVALLGCPLSRRGRAPALTALRTWMASARRS